MHLEKYVLKRFVYVIGIISSLYLIFKYIFPVMFKVMGWLLGFLLYILITALLITFFIILVNYVYHHFSSKEN